MAGSGFGSSAIVGRGSSGRVAHFWRGSLLSMMCHTGVSLVVK